MMEKVMENLKGSLVKVLFRDGKSVRSIKGVLVACSSDFIKIQTLSNQFLINRSRIFKIQKSDSDGKQGIN